MLVLRLLGWAGVAVPVLRLLGCGARAQVMEEGERLSKKQLAQESGLKKLRAQLEEAKAEKAAAAAALAAERAKVGPPLCLPNQAPAVLASPPAHTFLMPSKSGACTGMEQGMLKHAGRALFFSF